MSMRSLKNVQKSGWTFSMSPENAISGQFHGPDGKNGPLKNVW